MKLTVPTEVEIDGHKYRLNVVNARVQLHVVRKLAPFMAGMRDVAARNVDVGALAKVLADMSMEDVDFILDANLRSISRVQADGSAVAIMHGNGKLQFDDITGPTQYLLAQKAIAEYLNDFFAILATVI